MKMGHRGEKRLVWVGAVVLAAALVRLTCATLLVPTWEAAANRAPFPDRYPTLAASLVDAGTLGYGEEGARITTGRGPGFPAWLAVPTVFGLRGNRWIATWATVPGLLGAVLAAWTARQLARRPASPFIPATAAALAGLHPLAVFTSSRAMSDEACGVLGLAGIVAWCLSEAPRARAVLWVPLSGIALGLAMLTRATAVLFLVAMLAAALCSAASLRRALAIAFIALLPPIGWSLRSSALEGRPVFVHSLGAYNFWVGEAQDRFGFAPNPGQARERARALMVDEARLSKEHSELWHVEMTPAETAELETSLTAAAVRRVRASPASYALRVLRGLAWFWVRADTRATTLLYAAVVVPLLAFLLIGTLSTKAALRDPLLLALLLSIAMHTLFYAAVYPMARFSVAVYPCCAALAALGLTRLRYSGAAGVSPP